MPSFAIEGARTRAGRDRSVVIASLALVALAACSSGNDAPTADAAAGDTPTQASDAGGHVDVKAEALCNGSADPRLVYLNAGGGPRPAWSSFTEAYGYEFFVIDGSCRYWVGGPYLGGIHTGTLTAAAAEDIAGRLHRTELARLSAFSGVACPDASTRTLSDGLNRVSCTCDCTNGAPAGFAETFTNLTTVHGELMTAGAAADLPIRVVALANVLQGAPLAWPLTWSPQEVLVADNVRIPAEGGRLVTDTRDLGLLRGLRNATSPGSTGVNVKVSDEAQFLVLPRDQAPASVIAALATLQR